MMEQPEANSEIVEKPTVEVSPRATRRRFTKEYKIKILAEVDACSKPGEVGAILRREGIYSSHVNGWRRQRERGSFEGNPKKRGPKPRESNVLDKELRKLKAENARLLRRAKRAEAIIEVQKKVSEWWGVTLPKLNDDDSDS